MSSSFTTSTVNNNTNNTNNNKNKSQHDDVVVIEPHDNNFSNSNSNISSSSSSSSPKQDTNDITLYVSDMLSQMENDFQISGNTIINRMKQIGTKMNGLEHNISDLMHDAGLDDENDDDNNNDEYNNEEHRLLPLDVGKDDNDNVNDKQLS